MKDLFIVGITGRSGSGKSSVREYYASLGYPVADGDAVSRQVTSPGSPCLAELAAAFGSAILAEDGGLLRSKLGEIAFASPENTVRLNQITHPYITAAFLDMARQAKEDGARLFFADGAAIVGEDFEKHCDRIILVVAQQRLSVSRVILRDGISKVSAGRRLAAQLPEEQLRQVASYVIENNGGLAALYHKADTVLAALLKEVGTAELSQA